MLDLDRTTGAEGAQEQSFQAGALVAPLHIRSICNARDRALTLARQAADQLAAAYDVMEEADEAAKLAHVGFRGHRSDMTEEKALKRLSRGRFDPNESIEAFRLELDAAIWTRIIEETQIDQLMDFTERQEFEQALRKDVPPATAENIFATMERLTGDANLIFKRGIARCFAKLDPAFKSHDCFKIGKRMIFTHAFTDSGYLHWGRDLRDTLNDVERVFSKLDGRPSWGSILHALDVDRRGHYGPRQSETDTSYFKARGFMNGNLHLWIKPECKPLLDKVNRLLVWIVTIVFLFGRYPSFAAEVLTYSATADPLCFSSPSVYRASRPARKRSSPTRRAATPADARSITPPEGLPSRRLRVEVVTAHRPLDHHAARGRSPT